MPINAEKHLHHLDGVNLTTEEKLQFIHTIAQLGEILFDQASGENTTAKIEAALKGMDSKASSKHIHSSSKAFLTDLEKAANDNQTQEGQHD